LEGGLSSPPRLSSFEGMGGLESPPSLVVRNPG